MSCDDWTVDIAVCNQLTKSYGATLALDSASWSLRPGSLTGFLGPNGAGKTTTIRIMLGFLKPTSGHATVFGMDTWRQPVEIHKRLGYLPGDTHLYAHMTGAQHIDFIAGVRRLTDCKVALRIADALGIDLSVRVRRCSTGMRQKIALVLAMMHEPELLILDEPTSSLDPLVQQVLYAELRRAQAAGRTVLFSSHSLAEVESLCEDVVILRAGRVVASTGIDALRRQAGKRVKLRVTELSPADMAYPDGFSVDRCGDGVLVGRWQGPTHALLKWLSDQHADDVVIEPFDLEDVFLTYYSSDGSDEA
jgi:beta-exotoxin I transport system ATP-binding protein